MELKRTDTKTSAGTAGAAGAVGLAAAACVACCLPLLAPVLAWFGLAGLGAAASGWYLAAAGIAAAGLGAVLFILRRRAARALHRAGSGRCGCATSCKT